MRTGALESRPAPSAGDTTRGTPDWQRALLLAACCAVAGVTALVVEQSHREITLLSALTATGTIAAGVVVAAALLRLIDVLASRRQLQLSAHRSGAALDMARHVLEQRHPDVAARAARLDTISLVNHALHQQDRAETSK